MSSISQRKPLAQLVLTESLKPISYIQQLESWVKLVHAQHIS